MYFYIFLPVYPLRWKCFSSLITVNEINKSLKRLQTQDLHSSSSSEITRISIPTNVSVRVHIIGLNTLVSSSTFFFTYLSKFKCNEF